MNYEIKSTEYLRNQEKKLLKLLVKELTMEGVGNLNKLIAIEIELTLRENK